MLEVKEKTPQFFTVWSDKIEGRIDPSFYGPIFINNIELLDSLKTETIKLEKVAEIFSGARPKGGVGNIEESKFNLQRIPDFAKRSERIN